MVGATLADDCAAWDEAARLALGGIVVRHAESGVPIPDELLGIALDWLEHEDLEWDEETKRRLRREKEIALLRKSKSKGVATEKTQ
jgi:hypothetical protein